MGNVISEDLQYIGRIDNDGYVFDSSGCCIAKIDSSGYIGRLGGSEIFGKIDKDGSIRDASMSVVGRIQADGYVVIHSERICKVSSAFIKRITPKAWTPGDYSSFNGRRESGIGEMSSRSSSGFEFSWPFRFGTTLKLIAGVVLGVWILIDMGSDLTFLEWLAVIPMSIGVVFVLCFIMKIIFGLTND